MPPPATLAQSYATDEDIVNLAGADFPVLAPLSFKVAQGGDGVFLAGDLWTLTSASNNFLTQGVAANMVVQLSAPKSAFRGGGELLAVETVTSGGIALRRVGKPTGWGLPPAPAGGLTGVVFLITTLQGQLDDVSFKLNEQFSVDPRFPNRTPGDAYDLRVLKLATVYAVIARQYANRTRTEKGDFADKVAYYQDRYQAELDTAQLRWGPTGQGQPPTSRFGTRMSR